MGFKNTEKTFWSRVIVKNTDECWEWQGYKVQGGYGLFGINYRQILTHRYSWELHFGEIPEGLWVLHKCDNPACVNPEHLFTGTSEDNINDKMIKGRHKAFHGKKHSQETKDKIAKSNTGKRLTKERKQKISESVKKYYDKKSEVNNAPRI